MPHCELCGLTTHGGNGCPKRKRKRGKNKPRRRIVSFDCETNKNGIVLFLAAGADKKAQWVYSETGLSLETILAWLIEVGRGSLNFGFYFDYDVNQIVALLPNPHKGQLAATGKVTWRGFRIRHIPGKRFMVGNNDGTVTIWDCSSWAQTSFYKLCVDWKLGSESERELIRRMKAKRGDFDDATETELVEYTTLECALLSDWVDTLLKLHSDCDIKLRAYSGPGSTASALVLRSGWKPPEIPEQVQKVAELAFFGGRTEISCIGPVDGVVYGYDINSAYPDGIARLPELRGARWFHVKRFVAGGWGFYRVRWQQRKTDCWGMFPVRGAMLPNGRRSISLLYPTEGEGWFHSEEVANVLALNPGAVEVVAGWIIEPTGAPFDWVREITARRLEYKAQGDMRMFPLKVGVNSIYGKLAQHSGTHPLQCMAYAAAVTARTRAALLRAAYPRQHDVILLATDGILSRVPLDELPIGAGLGEWEHELYQSAWMLQAGVYWCGEKKRSRGIDARSLELADVRREWKRRGTAAEVELPTRRVMSYRLCASQGKLDQTGRWYDGLRSVRFNPAPRRRSYRWRGDCLLTIPARVADYKEWVQNDTMAIQLNGGHDFDEAEALPDWMLEE